MYYYPSDLYKTIFIHRLWAVKTTSVWFACICMCLYTHTLLQGQGCKHICRFQSVYVDIPSRKNCIKLNISGGRLPQYTLVTDSWRLLRWVHALRGTSAVREVSKAMRYNGFERVVRVVRGRSVLVCQSKSLLFYHHWEYSSIPIAYFN